MFSTQLCKKKKKKKPQHTQVSLINGAILVTVAITANSMYSHHSTRLVISNSHFPNNATLHIMTITSYHAISPFKFKHISSNSHMSKFPTNMFSTITFTVTAFHNALSSFQQNYLLLNSQQCNAPYHAIYRFS